MENRETRALKEIRVEAAASGKPKISGYAAVFDSRSEDLGGFVESIRPGAFAKSLDGGADVRALVGHDPMHVIGRNTAGTLNIFEDSYGLKVEIDPPDTTAGRDIVESIRRGDIDSMSFGFIAQNDTWTVEDGVDLRELIDVELLEISVVAWPAYQDTSVAVRSKKLNDETRVDPDEEGNCPSGYHKMAADDEHDGEWCMEGESHPTETYKARNVPATVDSPKANPDRPWDGDGARKRVREWAGGDKENIDWGKYAKAFAYFDGEDAEDFGSYKLPHHDIIDGKLRVVLRGVQSANGVMQGAMGGVDLPSGQRSKVQAHIDYHLKQFDKDRSHKDDGSLEVRETEVVSMENLRTRLRLAESSE